MPEARKVSGEKPTLVTFGVGTTMGGGRAIPRPDTDASAPVVCLFQPRHGQGLQVQAARPQTEFSPDFADMETHLALSALTARPSGLFTRSRICCTCWRTPGRLLKGQSAGLPLSGATTDLHHTLLQKRDGTFWLALQNGLLQWQDTRRPGGATPAGHVEVALGGTKDWLFRTQLVDPTERIAGSSEVRLEVPDEVLLVEIAPPKHHELTPPLPLPFVLDEGRSV